MAKISDIASAISAASQALHIFAQQIQPWRDISDRLLDLCQGMTVCQHVFERWQHKWEVNESQPHVYLRALFGHEGCHNIQLTLSSIYKISGSLQDHVDEIIGRALRFQLPNSTHSRPLDQGLVEACLYNIRRRPSWKQKFILGVWHRAETMEISLQRLEISLRVLESHTNYFLGKEQPHIFSDTKRLPGRKFILRLGIDRTVTVKAGITDILAAQRDGELLHRASDPGNVIHIGLSVPRIHPKDFAFLLPSAEKTHEFLVRPVRITVGANDPRVPQQLSSALPKLDRTTRRSSSPCVVKPSSNTDGFELSAPPISLLSALEHKAPMSAILTTQPLHLNSQTLYTRDQNALAAGLAQSTLRLLGTPWLHSLDSANVRWRRTSDGQWTSMLTANPGETYTTRVLDAMCTSYPLNARDLTRHTHIFRIGLVLAELCLRTRIRVSFDSRAQTIALHIRNGDAVRGLTAAEVAAEVDLSCNPFVGEMVFFCLGALMDKSRLGERDVQGGYIGAVVGSAENLESVIRLPRRKGTWGGGSSSGSSAGGSPRRVVSVR